MIYMILPNGDFRREDSIGWWLTVKSGGSRSKMLSGKKRIWLHFWAVFEIKFMYLQVLSYFSSRFFSCILGTVIHIFTYKHPCCPHDLLDSSSFLHFDIFTPAPHLLILTKKWLFEASFVAYWVPATPSVTSWQSSRWTPCAPWWSSWLPISTSSCWHDSCRSHTSLRRPPGSMPNSMPIWGGSWKRWKFWGAHASG